MLPILPLLASPGYFFIQLYYGSFFPFNGTCHLNSEPKYTYLEATVKPERFTSKCWVFRIKKLPNETAAGIGSCTLLPIIWCGSWPAAENCHFRAFILVPLMMHGDENLTRLLHFF